MLSARSVLVVDDSPAARLTCVQILRGCGVDRVRCASSGEEALQVISEQGFDVILCDYRMEGMDGVEFLEQLRARGDDTPCVILSGAPDKVGVLRATRHHAVDFYPKPFRIADLLEALNRVAGMGLVAEGQT